MWVEKKPCTEIKLWISIEQGTLCTPVVNLTNERPFLRVKRGRDCRWGKKERWGWRKGTCMHSQSSLAGPCCSLSTYLDRLPTPKRSRQPCSDGVKNGAHRPSVKLKTNSRPASWICVFSLDELLADWSVFKTEIGGLWYVLLPSSRPHHKRCPRNAPYTTRLNTPRAVDRLVPQANAQSRFVSFILFSSKIRLLLESCLWSHLFFLYFLFTNRKEQSELGGTAPAGTLIAGRHTPLTHRFHDGYDTKWFIPESFFETVLILNASLALIL